jgi:hypothetical protein
MVVLGATSDGIGLAANSPWWVSGAAALTVLLLIALRRTDAMPADPPFPG